MHLCGGKVALVAAWDYQNHRPTVCFVLLFRGATERNKAPMLSNVRSCLACNVMLWFDLNPIAQWVFKKVKRLCVTIAELWWLWHCLSGRSWDGSSYPRKLHKFLQFILFAGNNMARFQWSIFAYSFVIHYLFSLFSPSMLCVSIGC